MESSIIISEFSELYSGEEKEKICNYIKGTLWRIETDYQFLCNFEEKFNTILDIGGTPPVLVYLLKKKYKTKNIFLFDPFSSFYYKLLDKYNIAYKNISILDIKEVQKQKFDLISLCEVIEHINSNLITIITEIKRLINKDGYLYITTPNVNSIMGYFSLLKYAVHEYSHDNS